MYRSMDITINDNIKYRQLSIWDYQQKDSAEREGEAGVYSSSRMIKTDNTNGKKREDLLERIVSESNFKEAVKRVQSNKGAGGIDQMTVEELPSWLAEHQDELRQKLMDGKYRPKAVRRVEIPKDNGKTRALGIPTVVDRVIQQAICQELSPIYEAQFSDWSYGFRPKRSAHMALEQAVEFANEDYCWVVDMDLEKFFDTVNQSKLVQLLSNTIKDGRVISLIHKFMRAGIMDGGMFIESEEGVTQGGPLSPLLANIMLNESDQELTKRGLKFVRYADDMLIFTKSKRAAERVPESTTKYLEEKLFLRVNLEKTAIRFISNTKFLGYGFYIDTEKKVQLRVHQNSFKKLKEKLKKLTGRSNGMSIAERKSMLNSLITGWVQYFKLAKMKTRLGKLDAWLRRRLRMVTWKRWKLPRTKLKNLLKIKLGKRESYYLANTRQKYWYVAGSSWMKIAIPNKYFEMAGYKSLTACYAEFS